MTNPIVANKQANQTVQPFVAPKQTEEVKRLYSVSPVEKGGANIAAGGIALPDRKEQEAAVAKEVEEAVTQINDYVQNLQRNLQFSIDEESGKTVIKVIDSSTDELIRQIPSEKLLAVSRALEEFSGLLLEAKA